jgi:hypothetical protein
MNPVNLSEVTELLLKAREIYREIVKCRNTLEMVAVADIVAVRFGIFDIHYRNMDDNERDLAMQLINSRKNKLEDEIVKINEDLYRLDAATINLYVDIEGQK